MASATSVEVGDIAPDFTLPGTSNKNYSLSQFRGQTVVLVFYPGDETLVCTKQLCSYNNELQQFAKVNAQILAISAQDIASHESFSAKQGFKFPLLADTQKTVANLYSVIGLLGLPRRSVFVVDANGVIKYAHRAVLGVTFRPVSELIEAVAKA
ncbi:MAG: peroxiredoxin [Actinobacteria bacterium]|jgi:peroxiredoxin Q/BCP|nr:peroxiredoxin [Actinomycetota bacterium]NCU80467.1 peroxiredoxin [Acidimicrobiia bacterium]NDC99127.1 peroxiredoxin [bacterium]NBP41312.1 peroxiredoxin [Actinomycetota bacterium]NBQ03975.1 peroxiredoxin [Actinomycetota bacterium]